MPSYSSFSNLIPQTSNISIKQKRLSPIMQLIKKHGFFKVEPVAGIDRRKSGLKDVGYYVYIGKFIFAINEMPNSLQLSLVSLPKSDAKYKSQKEIKFAGLEILVEFAQILFRTEKNNSLSFCSSDTHSEAYLWQLLAKLDFKVEPVNTVQKRRFAHWGNLKSVDSISLRQLNVQLDDFSADAGESVKQGNNLVAAIKIEGEQICDVLHFSLIYSDWSCDYDAAKAQWNFNVDNKTITGIQDGDLQTLMLKFISALELGTAQLLAKLGTILYAGSSSSWVLKASNDNALERLYSAAIAQGATVDASVSEQIQQQAEGSVTQNRLVMDQQQIDLLSEQGQSVVSNQALDWLLFGYDKGQRAYDKQMKKAAVSEKTTQSNKKTQQNSWMQSKSSAKDANIDNNFGSSK